MSILNERFTYDVYRHCGHFGFPIKRRNGKRNKAKPVAGNHDRLACTYVPGIENSVVDVTVNLNSPERQR